MKRKYQTPKAIHVDFHYDVQVKATSDGSGNLAPYGDPQQIGRCQQSSVTSCTYFWTAGTTVCQSNPFSLGSKS